LPKDRTRAIPDLKGEPREKFSYKRETVLHNRSMASLHSGQFYEQLGRRILGGEHSASEWNGEDPRPDIEIIDRLLAVEVKAAGRGRYFKVDPEQLERYLEMVEAGFPYEKLWYLLFSHDVPSMVGRKVQAINQDLFQTTTRAVILDARIVYLLRGFEDFPIRDYRENWKQKFIALKQKPLWNVVTNGLVDKCGEQFRVIYGRTKLIYLQRPINFELRGILSSVDIPWFRRTLKQRTDSKLITTSKNLPLHSSLLNS
jgi:hypothetical protein